MTRTLVTSNHKHPAFQLHEENLHIIYQEKLNLNSVLEKLKKDFKCEKLTIQSGGTLNGLFLREKLFDYLDILMAPVLVGGKDTATLIDGESITFFSQLSRLGVLKLESAQPLKESYLRLRYKVLS